MRKLFLFLFAAVLCCTSNVRAGELTVADGTKSCNCVPFDGYSGENFQRVQIIYPQSELAAMAGKDITSLTFYVNSQAPSALGVKVQIGLAEISDSDFSAGKDYKSATLTIVKAEDVWDLNAATVVVEFSEPFSYSGEGNILFDLQTVAKGKYSNTSFYGVAGLANYQSAYSYNDSSIPATSPNRYKFIPKTTFTYEEPAPANSITINGTPAVGDNSISLTYYFNPANVAGFDKTLAPTLKVKCVTDNTYDEMWLSNTQISSGTETFNLKTLGEFKAGKSYVVCFAYNNGVWVDEVHQSFSFPGTIDLEYSPANAEIVWHDDLANPDNNNWVVEAIDLSNKTNLHILSLEKAGLTEIAGTYAWADLSGSECGITSFASEPYTDMHFTDGSCTVTVNGSDTTLTGTFIGEDGNTYNISISTSAPLTFTATAGSGGFNDDESHPKLIDGKYVESDWTKWCTNNDRKSTPDGESEACWWVDFQASEAIYRTGYILTTGNDNASENGRNPKDWVIKAKLNADDAWTTIASVTNDTKLQDKNFTDYEFDLDTPGKYKYFRFEVFANQGSSVMQLCELRLIGTEPLAACELSWMDVPEGGVVGTIGHEDEIKLPYFTASLDFLIAFDNGTVTLRLGSTDESVLKVFGFNNFQVISTGECDVYIVHDEDAVFAYDSAAFHVTVKPESTPEPTVWTALKVGDVIKVGDKIEVPAEGDGSWGINGNVLRNTWGPYELIRADIYQASEFDDPVVTELEDGAFYVFKAENSDFYPLSYIAKGGGLVVTMTSDGLEVKATENKEFTVAVHDNGDTPTAVENVQTNHVQATKILRDGQLLIIRDGKTYNVQGALVK